MNTLFSACAFVGIAWSVYLQRQELTETREQSEEQKQQLQEEKRHRERQAFEARFFQLLDLHRTLVDGFSYFASSKTSTGNEGFSSLTNVLRLRVGGKAHSANQGNLEIYEKLFAADFHTNLGHYFRSLYHILKLVDQAELSEEQKKFFTSILRSQNTSDQLWLLFYNCLSRHGEKMKPLVEKYAYLEHLPQTDFLKASYVSNYAHISKEEFNKFDRRAFGDLGNVPRDWLEPQSHASSAL